MLLCRLTWRKGQRRWRARLPHTRWKRTIGWLAEVAFYMRVRFFSCMPHSQRFGILQGAGPHWNYWSGREGVNRGHVDGGIDECRAKGVERFVCHVDDGIDGCRAITWRAWSGWSCPLLLNTTWKWRSNHSFSFLLDLHGITGPILINESGSSARVSVACNLLDFHPISIFEIDQNIKQMVLTFFKQEYLINYNKIWVMNRLI